MYLFICCFLAYSYVLVLRVNNHFLPVLSAGVYAYSAQRLHDLYPNVVFVSTVKGGACLTWSNTYASFAESTFDYEITSMPYTVAGQIIGTTCATTRFAIILQTNFEMIPLSRFLRCWCLFYYWALIASFLLGMF